MDKRGPFGGLLLSTDLFSQFLCTVIAILLHCFFLSTFAWLFVQGLHIYRMQTEARNVNFGAMRFYYAIGWGVPAIITGRCCLLGKTGACLEGGGKWLRPGAVLGACLGSPSISPSCRRSTVQVSRYSGTIYPANETGRRRCV